MRLRSRPGSRPLVRQSGPRRWPKSLPGCCVQFARMWSPSKARRPSSRRNLRGPSFPWRARPRLTYVRPCKKELRRGMGKRLRPCTFHFSRCALPLCRRDQPKNHPQALQKFLSKPQLGIEPPFPPRILAVHRASPDTPL